MPYGRQHDLPVLAYSSGLKVGCYDVKSDDQ
jgi:hypothetical protein